MFHKIAFLNHKTRWQLPESGLLDQIITIAIKKEHVDAGETVFPIDSLVYAATLADSFEIHVDNKSEPYVRKLHMTLQLLSKVSEVKVAPKIDLVYKL